MPECSLVPKSYSLFPLKTGQILACSQSDGNEPVFSDWVKRTWSMGDVSMAQCFKIYNEILSGPLALFASSLDN